MTDALEDIMQAGDILTSSYVGTYVLIEPVADKDYWQVFYLDTEEFSFLSNRIIQIDIDYANKESVHAGG